MNPTLLIVEDKTDLRNMLRRLLVHRGFDVVEARNGPEAVTLAEQHRPAAILMDIALPIFDGLEATRRIRCLPVVGTTPILFLTAHTTPETEYDIRRVGGTDWMSKPFDIDELITKLRPYLSSTP